MASSFLSSSLPCKFPKSGFVALDPQSKVEEEGLPSYVPEDYYPVAIGEVFESRYQVRLSISISQSKRQNNEIAVCNYLKVSNVEHSGKAFVRVVLDSFDITSPSGNPHQCLLYKPLGMSFTEFLDLLPENKFPMAT
ncbi:hypothetical protein AJ80_06156 [Polytolypa hystricis UAMH7299]|uniref:Uncharacterized protein n=1 Tax=Polytolypa hystricis (strain UAMH7299) TaxID=1447883 RepID=A0A2B7XZI7_POLH7|nr:hypothetical protein AJ80_06156 [Polytolypa hystricis UAMH7299]